MNRRKKAADLLEDARSTLGGLRAHEENLDGVRADVVEQFGVENTAAIDAEMQHYRTEARRMFYGVVDAISKAGRFGACSHPVEGLQQAISFYADGKRTAAIDKLETLAGEMHDANAEAGLTEDARPNQRRGRVRNTGLRSTYF